MNAKEHRFAGICAGAVCTIYMTQSFPIEYVMLPSEEIVKYTAVFAVFTGTFGSLLPDIDQPNSTLGRKLGPISKLLNYGLGHRGLLHYPIFLAALMLGLYLLYPKIPPSFQYVYIAGSMGFGAGYLSHIFLDMLNSAGIKFLWPVPTVFRIPTGISFKKGIHWKYLSGDNLIDRTIARLISLLVSCACIYFIMQ